MQQSSMAKIKMFPSRTSTSQDEAIINTNQTSPSTSQEDTPSAIEPPRKKAKFDEHINLRHLSILCLTEEDAIAFAQSINLIPKSVQCPRCWNNLDKLMIEKRSNSSTMQYSFKCNKRSCRSRISIFKNTWFENRRIGVTKSLFLTYAFVHSYSYAQAIAETSGFAFNGAQTSSETVSDTYSFCREVMVESLLDVAGEVKIGGSNCTVEIDEAKFEKTKYNRGRLVDGQWVLGGICRETQETFFVPVTDRDPGTLTDIILMNVEIGSTIYTDCLTNDNRLEELGYKHRKMNSNENSDYQGSGCHSNSTKNTWKAMKSSLSHTHKGTTSFGYHMAEYLWHRKNPETMSKFLRFLNDVARLYSDVW